MDSQNKNPDELLQNINKSILTKGLIIALAIHAVVIFGTSFALYRDWAKYGVKTPSAIKAEKKAQQIEAEKARREEEIQRKAAEAAAIASNAVPVKAESKVASETNNSELRTPNSEPTKKPPEIEPLPPATTDDIMIDLSF